MYFNYAGSRACAGNSFGKTNAVDSTPRRDTCARSRSQETQACVYLPPFLPLMANNLGGLNSIEACTRTRALLARKHGLWTKSVRIPGCEGRIGAKRSRGVVTRREGLASSVALSPCSFVLIVIYMRTPFSLALVLTFSLTFAFHRSVFARKGMAINALTCTWFKGVFLSLLFIN